MTKQMATKIGLVIIMRLISELLDCMAVAAVIRVWHELVRAIPVSLEYKQQINSGAIE